MNDLIELVRVAVDSHKAVRLSPDDIDVFVTATTVHVPVLAVLDCDKDVIRQATSLALEHCRDNAIP